MGHKTIKHYDRQGHARALNFSCYHNQPFLKSDRARQWLVSSIDRALELHGVDIWAWCIMLTHVHLLVFPRSKTPDISAFLTSVKTPVTHRVRAWVTKNAPSFLVRMEDLQPNGKATVRFWQRGPGFDRNLTSPIAVWEMIDYIHMNPVRDGLCRRPEDWAWSSAGWYKSRTQGPIRLDLSKLPPHP